MRKDQRTPRSVVSCFAVFALSLLLPMMMGGCPDFRNQSVTAFETAVRGVLNAGLDLYFDQFRTDEAK